MSSQPDSSVARVAPVAAPFMMMLKGALLPSTVAGVLASVVLVVLRGTEAIAGALLGLGVALAFFASGLLLMSRLVRSANPGAFMAVGMAVYFGQVIFLLLFMIAFLEASWVDGTALGLVVLAVTITWQVFSMMALRRARIPVYDEPDPSRG